ncbi:endocuticle structural glycoprotein SgAbd-2-like isoform X1 [Athalia rosae]|uniref:endocuticle structural glycoprotein SgAbd-2-like isoform X1 n=2 Tax=Athalia rosae TaxID=37344 RepID=UPI0020338CE9|nr:endocuticle structural glycoprotein SgAbd-2-like isoform X1 [Athalia rosae]
MNSLSFVAMLFGVAFAVQPGQEKSAPIESQVIEVGPEGDFQNSWSGNGIAVREAGSLKSLGNANDTAQVIQGVIEYTAPDGTPVRTTYVADENGARFEGAHLPSPPTPQQIPAYIAKAIEWAREHPYDEEALLKKTY